MVSRHMAPEPNIRGFVTLYFNQDFTAGLADEPIEYKHVSKLNS